MIVKILNQRLALGLPMSLPTDKYAFPEIMLDGRQYIYDEVRQVERQQRSEQWGWMTYGKPNEVPPHDPDIQGEVDYSVLILTFSDGSTQAIAANSDVFVCNDDGKTVEKMKHQPHFYPAPMPIVPDEAAKFMEWFQTLEKLAAARGLSDLLSPDISAWREDFDDGHTPEYALDQEMLAAQESA